METELRCRVCGAWLEEDDTVYVREDGTPVGCGACIHEEYGWQRGLQKGGEEYG